MSQPSTIEDGGGIPDKIREYLEEVYVGGSQSTGNPNPTITEDQLRRIIEQQDAANDPLPDAANDPTYLEEVKVYGKQGANRLWWLRLLFGIFRRGAPGVFNYPDWLTEALQNAENEITEETLEDDDEVEEEILNPGTVPGILDETPPPLPAKVPNPIEEVLVVARPLKHGHLTTITFPWRYIQSIPLGNPKPYAIPGYQPTPEFPNEPYPLPAPKKPPKKNPTTDPSEDDVLRYTRSRNPYIEGSLALRIEPGTGVRLSIRRRPARNKEENKLRRDRKEQMASRRYRQILVFVNKTYGEMTEFQDLWEVIAQNIYIDGRPLRAYKDPVQALKNADDWSVDWEQLVLDYVAMETLDRGLGKMSHNMRKVLNEMGYYGPNPGSYMPKPPTGP